MPKLELKEKEDVQDKTEKQVKTEKTKKSKYGNKILMLMFLINVIVLSIIFIMFVADYTNNTIIEEGVMNFWSMIGALGAFACSFIIMVLYIGSKIKEIIKQ